jgi:hypothetical protein
VHNSQAGQNLWDCPFIVRDWGEIEFLLNGLTIQRLIREQRYLMGYFSVRESLHFRQEHYITSWGDRRQRMDFLKALWTNHVFSVLMVPWDYARDEKLRRWLHAYEALDLQRAKPQQQEQAAVTDGMAAPATGPVTVNNPRWEHVDKQKRKDTPDIAEIGDSVTLKVDVTGIPEGAGVDFDLFDTASSSPTRAIERVHTRLQGGTASAQWTVKDPRKSGESRDIKLAFEGIARDKASERCEIPVDLPVSVIIRLDINPNLAESHDDTFTLLSTDNESTYRETLTIADDKVDGDNCVDLEFSGLKRGLQYSLEIDPGAQGKPYYYFRDKPLSELLK